MDLKQFKYYIAIAEECNLSHAAKKLYVSQSSLSRYLLNLESSLNVNLFVRLNNKSLVITEAGEELLNCYRDVVYQIEKCIKHIEEDKQPSERILICGVTSELGIRKSTSVFSEFTKAHPKTKIEFRLESSTRLIELLKNSEIDLARCVYDKADSSLKYIPIYRSRVNLFVPLHHPLASYKNTTFSLSDVEECTFTLPNHSIVQRKIIQKFFKENHFTPKDIIEVPTNLSALTLIEEGLAIGLLQEEYANDKVCSLKINPPLYYDIGFVYQDGFGLSRDAEDFVQMCLKEHKKSLPKLQ